MPGGQPLSQYATDYKQAKGNGGLTEPHERWPCSRPLTIALSASQRGQSIVAPRFVWITTERHRKEGERGATRSPFLAVRIEHLPNRPDLIQLRGYWLLSVDEFFSTYNADNMRRTDSASKKSIGELKSGAFILDLNWPDVQGYMHAEPSISVHRGVRGVLMMWQDDPDGVTLTHMIRRHLHGKSSSWPRLEAIEDVVGRRQWTVQDLLDSQLDSTLSSITLNWCRTWQCPGKRREQNRPTRRRKMGGRARPLVVRAPPPSPPSLAPLIGFPPNTFSMG